MQILRVSFETSDGKGLCPSRAVTIQHLPSPSTCANITPRSICCPLCYYGTVFDVNNNLWLLHNPRCWARVFVTLISCCLRYPRAKALVAALLQANGPLVRQRPARHLFISPPNWNLRQRCPWQCLVDVQCAQPTPHGKHWHAAPPPPPPPPTPPCSLLLPPPPLALCIDSRWSSAGISGSSIRK